jgi:hypothetical protein
VPRPLAHSPTRFRGLFNIGSSPDVKSAASALAAAHPALGRPQATTGAMPLLNRDVSGTWRASLRVGLSNSKSASAIKSEPAPVGHATPVGTSPWPVSADSAMEATNGSIYTEESSDCGR